MLGNKSIATQAKPAPFSPSATRSMYRVMCRDRNIVTAAISHDDAIARVRERGYRPLAAIDL